MWLLNSAYAETLQRAIDTGTTVTAEQQTQFEARLSNGLGQRITTMKGSSAIIDVSGMLTRKPDVMAYIFGGGNTTYEDIQTALATADADSDVEQIEMRFNSPGGAVDGLFDTIAAMQSAQKPIKATVVGMAASAAYALAAQADEIVASNRAASVGSVGIVASVPLPNDYSKKITSTKAPRKAPDASTAEGEAAIREELDALHELFVESIASGRQTNVDKVNAEFGQGGMLLADEALNRGMIDRISAASGRVVTPSSASASASAGGKPQEESVSMDLDKLKAQHPDVYAAAVQVGVDKERDRVSAHAIMGKSSGALDSALKAIEEGTEMTATMQATYMAAGMRNRDVSNRDEDDAAAAAAASGASGQETDEERDAKASSNILQFAANRLNVEV